jgi:hypothetical protein
MSTAEKIQGAGKLLYMNNVPNVEIARTLDVSETTVSNWVTKGGWRDERADSVSKKKARMDMLGDAIDYQLEALHQWIQRSRQNAKQVAADERVHQAARAMFLVDADQDTIMDALDIDEETLKLWIKAGGWMQARINADDEGTLRFIDKGDVDALAKMFSQVKGKELTFDNLVNLIRELIDFLNGVAPDLAKALAPYTNDFILSKQNVLAA